MATTYYAGPCPITYSTPQAIQPGVRPATPVTVILRARWHRASVLQAAQEHLRILVSIANTWPINSMTATLSEIEGAFQEALSLNPVASGSQDQTNRWSRGPGVDSIDIPLVFDPGLAFQEGVMGLEAMILNEDANQFTLSGRIPLYRRPVSMVENLDSFDHNNHTFDDLDFGDLPSVAASVSGGQVTCTVQKYNGTPPVSHVRVAFFDPRPTVTPGNPTPPLANSSWVSNSFVTAPGGVTWAGSPTGFRMPAVTYTPGINKQVVVIGYVDGVPTSPASVALP